MKIDMPEAGEEPDIYEFKVGNVYVSKCRAKTHYWILIGFDDRRAHVIGIDREGNITQAATYGRHTFEGDCCGIFKGRTVVGFAHGLDNLCLQVEFFQST